jgi:hypothetical protein
MKPNGWCALLVITNSTPYFPVFVTTSFPIVSWVLSPTRRGSVQGAIKLLSTFLKVWWWRLDCVLRPLLLLRCHPETTRGCELKYVIIMYTALKPIKTAKENFTVPFPQLWFPQIIRPKIRNYSCITRKMYWTWAWWNKRVLRRVKLCWQRSRLQYRHNHRGHSAAS